MVTSKCTRNASSAKLFHVIWKKPLTKWKIHHLLVCGSLTSTPCTTPLPKQSKRPQKTNKTVSAKSASCLLPDPTYRSYPATPSLPLGPGEIFKSSGVLRGFASCEIFGGVRPSRSWRKQLVEMQRRRINKNHSKNKNKNFNRNDNTYYCTISLFTSTFTSVHSISWKFPHIPCQCVVIFQVP